MKEEKIEETIENPTEEETVDEEETSTEDQETSKEPEASEEKPEELKAQRDRLYARLKKEEEKRKEVEQKLSEAIKKKSSAGEVDLDDLADKLSALQGLDSSERARLLRERNIQGASLEEARKSEDYKLWRSAYRAKIEKEKTAKPSTRQSITITEKPWEQMSSDEKVDWIKGIKIMNPKTGKYEPAQLLPRPYYRKK